MCIFIFCRALFPCGDTMVGIIDDREDVWNYAPNLIHVKPYRFFQGTADINAPPGLTKSENDDIPVSHKCIHQNNDESKTTISVSGGDDDDSSKERTKSDEESGEQESANSEQKSTKANVLQSESVIRECENLEGETSEQPCVDAEEKSACDGGEENLTSDDALEGEAKKESGEAKSEATKATSLVSLSPPLKTMDKDLCITNDEATMDDGGDDFNSHQSANEPETGIEQCEKTDAETKAPDDYRDDNSSNDKEKKEDVSENVKKNESEQVVNENGEVEWEDTDDYLLHLEEILKRVHTAYYDMYDQSNKNDSKQLPDLKNIIPYVKKKVLKGINIVFSGMFPLNMPMEKSKAFTVAKALGANVQNDIVTDDQNATTHLVAAKPGTGKHRTALKTKGLKVVNGDWLWSCHERWEMVDEGLYPLGDVDNSATLKSNSKSGKRKRSTIAFVADEKNNANDKEKSGDYEGGLVSTNKSSMQPPQKRLKDSHVPSSSTFDGASGDEKFIGSYNPLYSFSDEDIEFMDKEVDEIMAEDEGNVSDESDVERDSRLRKGVLGDASSSDSDSDSLSGDFPRGWKLRRKSFSPNQNDHGSDRGNKTDDEVHDDDSESELEKYQKTLEAFSPKHSASESDSDNASIGSVDDAFAEAVEKEFLSSL